MSSKNSDVHDEGYADDEEETPKKKEDDVFSIKRKSGSLSRIKPVTKAPVPVRLKEEDKKGIKDLKQFADTQSLTRKKQDSLVFVGIGALVIIILVFSVLFVMKHQKEKSVLDGVSLIEEAFQAQPETRSALFEEGAHKLISASNDKKPELSYLIGVAYYYKYFYSNKSKDAQKEQLDKDLSNASIYLNKAIEGNNELPGVHIYLGTYYYEKKIYNKALEEYDKEVKLAEKSGTELSSIWVEFIKKAKKAIDKKDNSILVPPRPFEIFEKL